ncbi:hypothetical protein ECEC1736_1560, partial [Escherichia coli EC1736]
MDAGETSAT